uniref:Elongation factor 1-gamma n=1 Tax=Cebus imitator TaxID=2715852 RepID=A0A2K5PID3_CEBIM
MAAETLNTYAETWRAFKALAAAQHSRAQVCMLSTPHHFHFGQTNRTPEFLHKFPASKVPAFVCDNGFCVFESNAIAYCVSNGELPGGTPEAAVQVAQWVSFADSDILPPAGTWVFPTLATMHHNRPLRLQRKNTFLVGEQATLADITVVCTLLWLYKQVLEPSFCPFRLSWGKRCPSLMLKSLQRSNLKRKEKGSREEKQKPQAAQKEEKKAAAPAPEEEINECEQALAAEPKAKESFAHLSKSTLELDEFKCKYSIEDTFSVALPYFWKHFHFDKDGWSLWYSEYHFPEELAHTFMSCNLITGMFQKNAFASVILFGTNNGSSISGVWVFRGQELAFPLSPGWQVHYESYTWQKLDPGSEETQTLGAFQHVGKAFNQGKIFK